MQLKPAIAIVAFFVLLSSARAQTTLPSVRAELVEDEKLQIEVRRARTGHLMVRATVNDAHAGWFIFDTGAGMTCVDRKFAEKAALPAVGTVRATGNGGAKTSRLLDAKSVQFGRVRIEKTNVVELDLDGIATAIGHEVDGVIGYECFYAGIFEVDVLTPGIAVHPFERFELPDHEKWHAIHWVARRPAVVGRIEAFDEGLLLLDLGANAALTVRAPTVERFKLLENRDTTPSISGGVGGMQLARKGLVSQIEFAGHLIEDVPTTFSQAARGALSGDDIQAVIGVGILGRFVTVLDYRNERVAFIPRDR